MFGRLTKQQESQFSSLQKTWILSAGRTGTQFFGEKLGQLLPDTLSVHEPDRINLNQLDDFRRKLARQGVFSLILGKSLGLSGTRNLSLRRIGGRMDNSRVRRRLLLERQWVLAEAPYAYIESNPQLFGLGEDLIHLSRSRVIILVRDPRSWLASWLEKDWFSDKDWMTKIGILGFKRLNPSIVGEEVMWDAWTRLQKLAWTWSTINKLLLDLYNNHPDVVRLYRFEKIFEERDATDIRSLLAFASWGAASKKHEEIFVRMLDEKVNATERRAIVNRQPLTNAERASIEGIWGEVAYDLGYAM